MMKLHPLRENSGFGIVEVMVGAALLMTSILGAMFITGISSNTASDNPISIGIEIARTSLINNIQSDLAWSATVKDPANTSLACLKNSTTCFGGTAASGAFTLKDAANQVAYDGLNVNAGFTIQGTRCTTYDPVNGNPQCPIRFNLSWEALCTSAPCLNPPVKVVGTVEVKFTNKRATVINLNRFNFESYRRRIYCKAVTNPWNFVIHQAPAMCSNTTAASTTNALVYPAGMCRSAAEIDPCLTTRVTYNYALSYTAGALPTDATNQARFCFYDSSQPPASSPCIYEWSETNGIWSLSAEGAVVYTAPATETLNTSIEFEFRMNNGMMAFYVNGTRRYLFVNSFRLPMRILLMPGSTAYAPSGFYNLRYNAQ